LQGLRNQAKQVAALEEKFQALEGDDDGKVSKVQLHAFLQKEGAFEIFDTTEVTEVMARFDQNQSGHLDPEEMKKVREVIRLKKAQLAEQIHEAENEVIVPSGAGGDGGSRPANSRFLARRQRGGSQISDAQNIAIRTELAALQDNLSEVQARLEKQAQVEKKLLSAVELIGSKVESLVDREKDFRFLRKGLTGDYLS
jgi:hypothetical protein